MPDKKRPSQNKPLKRIPTEKNGLHPRNPHKARYNFQQLITSSPLLKAFVKVNQYGKETIDFADPKAVKALNKALLKYFYEIDFWDIPEGCLCPPVPGRADYIHTAADILAASFHGNIPRGKQVKVLDIGVGANCIYPVIGCHDYGWSFIGTDIDKTLIESAGKIVSNNPFLTDLVELRLQTNKSFVFQGVIKPIDRFDLTICNPPFHASPEEALEGTLRKQRNLGIGKSTSPVLNFGGQNTELWCEGGEKAFVIRMIRESAGFVNQCRWFTTLISKKNNLPAVYQALKQAGAAKVKTFEMTQGQKMSRVVAWTFNRDEAVRTPTA